MERRDIVRWIIDALRERDASCLTPEGLMNLELDIRAHWGGQRPPYVAKKVSGTNSPKLSPEEERKVLRRAIDTDTPTEKLARESGISRATLYRLLKRG